MCTWCLVNFWIERKRKRAKHTITQLIHDIKILYAIASQTASHVTECETRFEKRERESRCDDAFLSACQAPQWLVRSFHFVAAVAIIAAAATFYVFFFFFRMLCACECVCVSLHFRSFIVAVFPLSNSLALSLSHFIWKMHHNDQPNAATAVAVAAAAVCVCVE